ncbi:hypothetical protein H696_02588 [Fonticula alba]|uniref:Uncharacterized protein n=1 Tax=Fonticula alba TaxID=691883 RepID=A0A058Z8K6_FONAL|nr:hypothetical protein H696_02588 [Fonticula alba]KCV70258.1 hypothetical protein H696_02588 [Fonticula alba]|eukprot:XP_009494774.1 hypothetical protein H696_02588 [Fonticula alba]
MSPRDPDAGSIAPATASPYYLRLDFFSVLMELLNLVVKLENSCAEAIASATEQNKDVSVAYTVGTTATVVSGLLLLTPLAPLAAGVLVASAATTLGTGITDFVMNKNRQKQIIEWAESLRVCYLNYIECSLLVQQHMGRVLFPTTAEVGSLSNQQLGLCLLLSHAFLGLDATAEAGPALDTLLGECRRLHALGLKRSPPAGPPAGEALTQPGSPGTDMSLEVLLRGLAIAAHEDPAIALAAPSLADTAAVYQVDILPRVALVLLRVVFQFTEHPLPGDLSTVNMDTVTADALVALLNAGEASKTMLQRFDSSNFTLSGGLTSAAIMAGRLLTPYMLVFDVVNCFHSWKKDPPTLKSIKDLGATLTALRTDIDSRYGAFLQRDVATGVIKINLPVEEEE